jgi:hypothetical protein
MGGRSTDKLSSSDEARNKKAHENRKLANIIIPKPQSTHMYLLDPLFNVFIELTPRGGEPAKIDRPKTASETVRRLKYDYDFISTSGARFHTDHTNLATGLVPITTG